MTPTPSSYGDSDVFARRREAVFDALGDAVMVLPSAPIQRSSRDNERPYVPDRELWYLTGLVEPGTIGVLIGGDERRLIVFARPRDETAELWAGQRIGPEGAAAASGADEAHPIETFTEKFAEVVGASSRIYYRLGRRGVVQGAVLDALEQGRARGQRTGSGVRGVVDPGEILDELRLRKDASEVEAIREACRVTEIGHAAGARLLGPGVGEWEIEAAINAAFRSEGGSGVGFETIVGSGSNGCVLHYVDNSSRVEADSLVLIDAGAAVRLYNGDVTRTWPASGRFTSEQRAVYTVVDEARQAAIEEVRPGVAIGAVHEVASSVLAQGLIELGVLDGPLGDVLESAGHRAFFPHQTSHWLGLDVHDPGDYAKDGVSRTLEPGMVFTIEPGLYFGPAAVAAGGGRYEGIGVRIEDDVCVTEEGVEVLTPAIPTDADEVEAFLAG